MVVIGLSPNRDAAGGADCMPRDYVLSILRAGAVPLIFPMLPEDHPRYDELLDSLLKKVDGLVFTGGPDIDPSYFGEERHPACHEPLPERDRMDLALFSRARASGKPFLGICRGLQVCNVAMGGTLYQDLAAQHGTDIPHQQNGVRSAHEVTVEKGSLLGRITQAARFPVTSRHHQAIKGLAPGLAVTARSDDGVIEAVELTDGQPGLCLQWHPENLSGQDERQQALFDWLVREAGRRA